MAGTPASTDPAPPPAPQYAPYATKQPGATAAKVWGIILILVGVLLAFAWLIGLASLGGGFTGTEFAIGMDDETKRQINESAAGMIQETKGRWTFWATQLVELAVIALSITAGVLLVAKPRPLGAKLALARALLVLLALPLTGYENTVAVDSSMDMQKASMDAQLEGQIKQEEARRKMTEAEKTRRRAEIRQVADGMAPVMRGVTYGAVVITVILSLVFNSVLLFFMTRPNLKTYLEDAATNGNAIHGYHPSMGMMGPPPGPPPV
jgi:hypothetical protein